MFRYIIKYMNLKSQNDLHFKTDGIILLQKPIKVLVPLTLHRPFRTRSLAGASQFPRSRLLDVVAEANNFLRDRLLRSASAFHRAEVMFRNPNACYYSLRPIIQIFQLCTWFIASSIYLDKYLFILCIWTRICSNTLEML